MIFGTFSGEVRTLTLVPNVQLEVKTLKAH